MLGWCSTSGFNWAGGSVSGDGGGARGLIRGDRTLGGGDGVSG